MITVLALASIAAAYLVLRRHVDFRRLDDPFVAAFVLFSALWIAGLGLGERYAAIPQMSTGAVALLVSSYAAFVIGGLLRAPDCCH